MGPKCKPSIASSSQDGRKTTNWQLVIVNFTKNFKNEENITKADAVQSCSNLDRFGISGFGKSKPITPSDKSKNGLVFL